MKLKTSKQMGFGAIGILAVVAILALVGFSGWLVMDRKNTKDAETKSAAAAAAIVKSPTTSSALKTTTVKSSSPTKKAVVTVKHPSGWEVSNTVRPESDTDGPARTLAYIKSPKGHYLHINDVSGVGGTCDADTNSYTLVKRISTGVKDTYFSEYKKTGGEDYLSLADLSKSFMSGTDQSVVSAIKTMKEGETRTNTCDIAHYSFVKGELYVSITGSSKTSLASSVPYSELKDDTEFIAMLQSLSVVE